MFWGTPSFFWDKKSTMILFENFKKHPPTPRVLLGLCSIKKVPAPPPPPPPRLCNGLLVFPGISMKKRREEGVKVQARKVDTICQTDFSKQYTNCSKLVK